MRETDAASLAAARVRQVAEGTGSRVRLATEFYRAAGRERGSYGRAELAFLRWEIARGVLNPPAAATPGSPWWRAVNDRLLRDKIEAALLYEAGAGRPSARSVDLWVEFLRVPSPAAWYRAHNSSVVAGYLDNVDLAEAELPAERFMMNVALLRVLYTHALTARPRLALGSFGGVGRLAGDPRRGSVGFFLDLRHAFPERYPLTGLTVEELVSTEASLPRLLDYGIIAPRLTGLYSFAAAWLGEPRVMEMISHGTPCYALPAARPELWREAGGGRMLTRFAAYATGAGGGRTRRRPASPIGDAAVRDHDG
ncbi:hypothetical protein ACGFNU_20645 [Spirillospora sp. NPDC048911]|uniref:hypothetical protein n=1 Tax=Spirillospora sp. NPDC048911 TaxID=3364527 RepID=UPI003715843E